ncbi:MAG TPA: hypothetical protein VGM90_28605 [Kofleriaceae bacterium]
MTRAEFLKSLVGTGVGAVIFVSACGGGGGSAGDDTIDAAPNVCTSPSNTIAANHPAGTEHILMVPIEDVNAGVAKTYHIMGNATHDHTVAVAAAQWTMIKAGTSVAITSSETVHTHVVTIRCVS